MSEDEPIEALLQAYLDDELDPGERERVEASLGDPRVKAMLEELIELSAQLRTLYAAREAVEVEVAVAGVPAVEATTAATAAPAGEEEVAVASGYRVVRQIAKGGFGAVYRAVQLSVDRPVALKIMAPHLAQNEEYVKRFLREARLAATLNHPNLVTIYDVGQQGEQLYYSMELVEGEDAEAVLKRDGFLEQRRAVEVAEQVAGALVAASEANIVHRDIKPANILITPDGAVKLADLGLARGEGPQSTQLTMKKRVIGSPNYMSPEQAQDMRTATSRSDVYSLGATLLHLISGKIPFGSGSPVEILARVLRDEAELPTTLPDGEKLDADLAALLEECLAKDPQARPTPTQLRARLAAFLSGVSAGRPARSPSARRGKSRRTTGRRPKRKSDAMPRRDSQRQGDAPKRDSERIAQVTRGGPPTQYLAYAAAALVLAVAGLVLFGGDSSTPADPVSDATTEPRTPETTPNEDPATPDEPTRNRRRRTTQPSSLESELASLTAWCEKHSDRISERFARASAFMEAHAGTPEAEQAQALRDKASAQMQQLFEFERVRAQNMVDEGRSWDARVIYEQFLETHGRHMPSAGEAERELQTLDTAIKIRLDADMAALEAALADNDVQEAEAIVNRIRPYAGPDAASRGNDQVVAHLATSPEPTEPTDPPGPVGPDALDRETQARSLLADARTKLAERDYAGAEQLLNRLREDYPDVLASDQEMVGELLASARGDEPPAKPDEPKDPDQPDAPDDKKPTELDEPALFASVFRGEVEALGEGRLRVTYDFEDEDQALDWVDAGARGPRRSPVVMQYLESQVKGRREPWTVYRDSLASYGWTRRELPSAFRTDQPITVSVEAQDSQNVGIAFHQAEYRALVVGLNHRLPDLPILNLGVELRGAGIDNRKDYLAKLKRNMDSSQQRKSSLVVYREHGFMDLNELLAVRTKAKKKLGFEITMAPDGEMTTLDVAIGRGKLDEPVIVEGREWAKIALIAMGPQVRYDTVTIEGTLTKTAIDRMREAAKAAGQDPEKVREELDKAAQKRKEEAERKEREKDRDRDKD